MSDARPRARIAVLASGGGSNLGALLAHFDTLGDARAGDVVLVASDQPHAGALERARARGIPTVLLRTKANPDAATLHELLRARHVDLVVLAGFLRLVPAEVVREWRGRIVNVHPGPLPQFGGPGMHGLHVHEVVLEAGVPLSGPTVHFVDEAFDTGPVIAHEPVPVLKDDTPQSLAARVLAAEHHIFPRVIQAVAAGEVTLGKDGKVAHTTTQLLPQAPGPRP